MSILFRTSLIQGRWWKTWVSIALQQTKLKVDAPEGYIEGCRTNLVFFQAVLKDVLYNQTTRLSERNFMPHATKGFIDILHDLGRRVTPA